MTTTPQTTLNAGQGKQLADAMGKAMLDAYQHLRGPGSINPASGFETDNQGYRFDARSGQFGVGGKPEHDFSTDLFCRDPEAQARALSFVQSQFATSTGDVAAANPNGHQPAYAVDQPDYQSPLWQSISTGVIDNNTPFVVPKFSTATNLVSAHTSGTAPTDGTFVLVPQTVTPGAVSGRVEIPREVVDAGGNPQVSGWIWTRMVAAYNEMLEQAVAAALLADAANIEDLTLPAGVSNAALVDAILAEFVELNYVRGGFKFTTIAAHTDLYHKLATAVDSDNRPLLPHVGGVNAAGSVGKQLTSIDLQGVNVLPSWALGAPSAGVSNSWLIDPAAVWGWASVPRKLDFDYRVESVTLAIWGYQACAVLNPAGVRQIRYTPTAP